MSEFHLFDSSLGLGTSLLLVASLAVALAFEFVNGFHDTANAVATVIYTKSLGPRKAVAWSGFCNFLGVYLGGTAVAFGIVSLLPVDLLVSIDSAKGLAMVMALLIAAIAWNLGTWLMAIPASSSHTLIGAILGVGLANSAMHGQGVRRGRELGQGHRGRPLAPDLAADRLRPRGRPACSCSRRRSKAPELYQPPEGDKPPPGWIRGTLLLTCTGVSLAHGSNDGQKGIGLIMLILIGVLPAHYALDPRREPGEVDADPRRRPSDAEGADRASHPAEDRPKRLAELADLRERLGGKAELATSPPGSAGTSGPT